jgi:hypothetical protein
MRPFIRILLFLIVLFPLWGNFNIYAQDLIIERNEHQNTPTIDGLELTNNQFKNLSAKITSIVNSMTDEYQLSDTISLSFYILKYFSEIGEYEIEGDEIIKLTKGFLKLSNKNLPNEIWKLIYQVRKIKFGKKKGKAYVQFSSKKADGIIYNINEYLAAEDSRTGTLIKKLIIRNGAELYFDEIKTAEQYLVLADYIRSDNNALKIPMSWYRQLNDVNLEVRKNILFYLNLDNNINPLSIELEGIQILVLTNSIFKRLTFDVLEGYAMPGMTDGEVPLPSTIFKAQTNLLRLKLTIDQ